MDFLKGALWSIVVNLLNVVGWFVLGPWVPSAITAFVALAVAGICGLDNRWRIAVGYWTVQVMVVGLWLIGAALPASLLPVLVQPSGN